MQFSRDRRASTAFPELTIAPRTHDSARAPEQVSARSERPRPWHVWLIVVVVGINLSVALTPHFFPYGDTPNHLARYTLIGASWRGAAPEWVQFRWLPTGYIAIDVLGAALATLTSPLVALRVLVSAYIVLLPFGTFALIRAVNPRAVGWSLVACLLTFNWYFLAGFLSYSIGIALALLWLAWWWPRRNRRAIGIRLVGAIGIVILYLVHMAAAATALIPVGVACVEPLLAHSRRHKLVVRRMVRRITAAMLYFIPALTLNVLMKWSRAAPKMSEAMSFRPTEEKFRHVLAPFVSFSRIDGIVVLLAYSTALALCWSARTRDREVSLWPLSAAAMLIFYFVCPVLLLAAWDVDVRFLLPAALIAFVASAPDAPLPPSGLAIGLLAGLTIAHAGETRWNASRVDASVDQFMAILQRIPVPASTLVLVADEGDFFRVDPFLYVGEWLTIRHSSSRVNGLFSGSVNASHLGHFVVCPQLYDPGVHWARDAFPALAWDRIRDDYSYIALAGTSETASLRIRAGAIQIVETGAGSLYLVMQRVSGSPNNFLMHKPSGMCGPSSPTGL